MQNPSLAATLGSVSPFFERMAKSRSEASSDSVPSSPSSVMTPVVHVPSHWTISMAPSISMGDASPAESPSSWPDTSISSWAVSVASEFAASFPDAFSPLSLSCASAAVASFAAAVAAAVSVAASLVSAARAWHGIRHRHSSAAARIARIDTPIRCVRIFMAPPSSSSHANERSPRALNLAETGLCAELGSPLRVRSLQNRLRPDACPPQPLARP